MGNHVHSKSNRFINGKYTNPYFEHLSSCINIIIYLDII